MQIRQIKESIKYKILYLFSNLFSWDILCGVKIIKRKDMQCLGTEYGGWFIPVNLLDPDSICYCVGCGEDISFDLALIEKFKCNVHGFDPTPKSIRYVEKHASGHQKYHFFNIGLWDKTETLKFYAPANSDHVSHSILNLQKTTEYIEVPVKRLCQIMQDNNHKKLDLLKLDIEGAEYKVLDSILEDNLDINIICVEFDECFNPIDKSYTSRIRNSVLKLLENGYEMIYLQGRGNYTFVKSKLN